MHLLLQCACTKGWRCCWSSNCCSQAEKFTLRCTDRLVLLLHCLLGCTYTSYPLSMVLPPLREGCGRLWSVVSEALLSVAAAAAVYADSKMPNLLQRRRRRRSCSLKWKVCARRGEVYCLFKSISFGVYCLFK